MNKLMIFLTSHKFTRLVNNKRLVVGAKQEPGMKITRCFDITIDEKAIYLVREEVNTSAKRSSVTTTTASEINEETSAKEPSMRADNIDVECPALKRYKISHQPTILDFATGQSHPQKAKSDLYSAARARKVKIFTESVQEFRKYTERSGTRRLKKFAQTATSRHLNLARSKVQLM